LKVHHSRLGRQMMNFLNVLWMSTFMAWFMAVKLPFRI